MIPRVIHRIWLGPPMPDEFERYGDGWQTIHPDWRMKLWTEESLPRLRNQDLYDRAEKIAPASIWQFRADVVRYELLEREGGLYVDADMECRRSFAPLLVGVDLMAAWEVDDVWMNNAMLGATVRHPFITALVDGLAENVARNRGKPPNHLSGPRYLTRLYKKLQPPITILPARSVYPYRFDELWREGEEFPEAHAIHRWHNRRSRQRPHA